MINMENNFKEWFGDRQMPKDVNELYKIVMDCPLGSHLRFLEDELYRREMNLLDREQTLVMKEKLMIEAIRNLEKELQNHITEKFHKIKIYKMNHGITELTDFNSGEKKKGSK